MCGRLEAGLRPDDRSKIEKTRLQKGWRQLPVKQSCESVLSDIEQQTVKGWVQCGSPVLGSIWLCRHDLLSQYQYLWRSVSVPCGVVVAICGRAASVELPPQLRF